MAKKTKKLYCAVTGRSLVLSKDYYQKKLDKCDGDEDVLQSSYICKEAKDLIKRGYDVEKTRDLLGVEMDSVVSDSLIEQVRSEGRMKFRNVPKDTISKYTSTKTDSDVSAFLDKVFNK